MPQRLDARQRPLFDELATPASESRELSSTLRNGDFFAGAFSVPAEPIAPDFVAPDRQEDLLDEHSATPFSVGYAVEQIAIERDVTDIDGPPHRFWIRVGDVVEAVIGPGHVAIGMVLAVDREQEGILVDLPEAAARTWLSPEVVYPIAAEEEGFHLRFHAQRWERLLHLPSHAWEKYSPGIPPVGDSSGSRPHTTLTKTAGHVDAEIASGQGAAAARLRELERHLARAPIVPWSDEFAEEAFLDLPAGQAIWLDEELWASVLDVRPMHLAGYEDCDCEAGEGGPFLFAWRNEQECFVRELSDDEARKLQEACLAAQQDVTAAPPDAKRPETQRALWE